MSAINFDKNSNIDIVVKNIGERNDLLVSWSVKVF